MFSVAGAQVEGAAVPPSRLRRVGLYLTQTGTAEEVRIKSRSDPQRSAPIPGCGRTLVK